MDDTRMRRPTRVALAAAVIAVAWFVVYLWATTPHRWQGRVVLTVADYRGVHSSDLPTIAAATVISLVALRWATVRR